MDKSVISSREDEPASHTWPHVSRSSRRDSGDEKTFIELLPDLGVSLGQNIKHLSLLSPWERSENERGLKIVICLTEE